MGTGFRFFAAFALLLAVGSVGAQEASQAESLSSSLTERIDAGDFSGALGDAEELYALGPKDFATVEALMAPFYAAKRYEELAAFFEWGLKSYLGDDEALGNLYYHYSQLAHDTKDDLLARDLVDKAEKAYRRAGVADEKTLGVIERQRDIYGE
jgi:hypothetical protein